jgi:hypothetical protein
VGVKGNRSMNFVYNLAASFIISGIRCLGKIISKFKVNNNYFYKTLVFLLIIF